MKKPSAKQTSASLLRTLSEQPREVELTAAPHRVPTNQAPTCDRCATAEYLVYDQVVLVLDARGIQPPAWDVEYWCGRCESVYGMLTTHVPGDRLAVRLAADNPRVVHYPAKVPASACTTLAPQADASGFPGLPAAGTSPTAQLPLAGGRA